MMFNGWRIYCGRETREKTNKRRKKKKAKKENVKGKNGKKEKIDLKWNQIVGIVCRYVNKKGNKQQINYKGKHATNSQYTQGAGAF